MTGAIRLASRHRPPPPPRDTPRHTPGHTHRATHTQAHTGRYAPGDTHPGTHGAIHTQAHTGRYTPRHTRGDTHPGTHWAIHTQAHTGRYTPGDTESADAIKGALEHLQNAEDVKGRGHGCVLRGLVARGLTGTGARALRRKLRRDDPRTRRQSPGAFHPIESAGGRVLPVGAAAWR